MKIKHWKNLSREVKSILENLDITQKDKVLLIGETTEITIVNEKRQLCKKEIIFTKKMTQEILDYQKIDPYEVYKAEIVENELRIKFLKSSMDEYN